MQAGGCLCGAVRYEVTGEPLSSGVCHCRTCQRVASAPRLPFAVFAAGLLRFTRGTPVTFHSSPDVVRSFCAICGSPLTYRREDQPDRVDIMTISLDDPAAFPPTHHAWLSHRIAWDVVEDGLPGFATSRATGKAV